VPIVNMLEAKSSLSRLVAAVQSGAATEIVLARNDLPAARLVPLAARPAQMRIGVARGQFLVPDDPVRRWRRLRLPLDTHIA
jgi:antitoxin (DNA-binding transcriptional repressor) of toxin-antitoxin stability system